MTFVAEDALRSAFGILVDYQHLGRLWLLYSCLTESLLTHAYPLIFISALPTFPSLSVRALNIHTPPIRTP